MIEPDGKEHKCERCGECCMHGSPTLHLSDFKLFEDGILKPEEVYTLRKGELAYDNVAEEVDFLNAELIKVREVPDSRACMFFDPEKEACRIYDRKPMQCFYFECWNPKKFFKTLEDDKLSRTDLFHRHPQIVEMIKIHEQLCSYEKIKALVEEIQNGSESGADELLKILHYDTDIRTLVPEKFNFPPDAVELLFGRSLLSTIEQFGYKIEEDKEGAYCLILADQGK